MSRSVQWTLIAALVASLAFSSTACDVAKFGAGTTVKVMKRASKGFDKEKDPVLAETAVYGNLKMMEGLMEVIPDNADLQFLAAKAFVGAAAGFIETHIDAISDEDNPRRKALTARAIDFYERGKKYALKWIELEHYPGFGRIINQGDLNLLKQALKKMDKDAAPGLFWLANAWSGTIRLQLDNMKKILELPRPAAIMERVIELDETYYHGGAHVFFGGMYSMKAKSMGGDPDKAKQHFERAWEIGKGKVLLAKFFKARFYAVAIQNREMFTKLLREIIAAPPELSVDNRLLNELMKAKARIWLKRADDLF